jgi:hypothetical protein
MSYAHYFQQKKSLPEDVLKKIVEKMHAIAGFADMIGHIKGVQSIYYGTMPVIRENGVSFKGAQAGDSDFDETFSIILNKNLKGFCATGGRPYDAVVTACLLAVMSETNEEYFAIHSDGNIHPDEEWRNGYAFYARTLMGGATDENMQKLDEVVSANFGLVREKEMGM